MGNYLPACDVAILGFNVACWVSFRHYKFREVSFPFVNPLHNTRYWAVAVDKPQPDCRCALIYLVRSMCTSLPTQR